MNILSTLTNDDITVPFSGIVPIWKRVLNNIAIDVNMEISEHNYLMYYERIGFELRT